MKNIRKTNNLYLSEEIPQEMNIAALRARGYLHELYTFSAKYNTNKKKYELFKNIKNSEDFLKIMLNSEEEKENLNENKKNFKLKQLDIELWSYLRKQNINKFINEEKIRAGQALNIAKVIENYYQNKSKKIKFLTPIKKKVKQIIKSKSVINKKNNLNEENKESKDNIEDEEKKEKVKNENIISRNIINNINDSNIFTNDTNINNWIEINNINKGNSIDLFKRRIKKNNSNTTLIKVPIFLKNISNNQNINNNNNNRYNNNSNIINSNSPNIKDNSTQNSKIIKKDRKSVILPNNISQILNDSINKNKKEEQRQKQKFHIKKNNLINIKLNNLHLSKDNYEIKKIFASPSEKVKNVYYLGVDKNKLYLPSLFISEI